MPRASDYSAVSFYKIVCNDPDIVDFYVGSTTNLVKRRCQHKSRCKSGDTSYVYEFIRSNGNWINWTVLEICNKACIDKSDMLRTERNYIEDLKATLNKVRPIVSIEETKEKHAISDAIYRSEHKEQAAIYRSEHKEQTAISNAIYRSEHKEQAAIYRSEHKEQAAKYRLEHKEDCVLYKAKYYQKNKDHINQLRRDKRLKNKSSI